VAAARERATLTARVAELERHVGSLHKAAAAGRDAEREAVVDYLRTGCRIAEGYADAIERGEHREGEGL
jgi:hypothetical protein